MKLKKLLALTLATTMSITALAACGSKPAAPEVKEEAVAETTTEVAETEEPVAEGEEAGDSIADLGEVTLKVATWDLDSAPYINPIVEAFEAKYPNITVEISDTPSADYTNKLSIMLNGGSDVDAFWVKDADTIKALNDKGQLADLTEYINRDGVDLSAYNGLAENFIFDNKVVGLPARTDYYVLYYNKDIFDAAGVEYPSNDMTWEEFEATAKQITSGSDASKTYGALIHTWQACVENWGVQDGKHTIMDTDYSFFKPYYEMALRMQNDDKSIQDYATLKSNNIHYSSPFLLGQVGMMPMGTWFMSTIISKINDGESTINWGVATIPHAADIEAGYTVGSTTPMCVNNASENKEAAWEFAKFVSGSEGASHYAATGAIPAMTNDEMLAQIAVAPGMPEGVLEALAVKNITLDRPIVDKVGEVNQMLAEEHDLIMLGELTVDEGLAEMGERSAEIQGQ